MSCLSINAPTSLITSALASILVTLSSNPVRVMSREANLGKQDDEDDHYDLVGDHCDLVGDNHYDLVGDNHYDLVGDE